MFALYVSLSSCPVNLAQAASVSGGLSTRAVLSAYCHDARALQIVGGLRAGARKRLVQVLIYGAAKIVPLLYGEMGVRDNNGFSHSRTWLISKSIRQTWQIVSRLKLWSFIDRHMGVGVEVGM